MRADRAREAGQWQLAAGLYRIALDRRPNNPPIWIQHGHALKESGHHADAEAAYRMALAYDPEDADAHLQLGHVLKLQDKIAAARVAYRRALELDASLADAAWELSQFDPDVWFGKAPSVVSFITSEQTKTSGLPAFDGKTTRRDLKRLRGSLVSRADRARDAGQWDIAATFYRKALDRNPNRPEIWVQYGHALKEAGYFAEAEAAYRAAILRDGNAADPHLQLGHALKLQGKIEEARAAYLCAFVLDSHLCQFKTELIALGWTEGHITEVRRMLEADLELGPEGSHSLQPQQLKEDSTEHAASGTSSNFVHERRGNPDRPNSAGSYDHSKLTTVSDVNVQLIRESGLFDEEFYRANNPDLKSEVDVITHFIDRGASEGRWPNRMFDPAFYLRENPDVAEKGGNPLVHFITYGAAEGRRPHPQFSPSYYLSRYTDVVASGLNPLFHYLRFGEIEGRSPTALDYEAWCELYDTLTEEDRTKIRSHLAQLEYQPVVSLILDTRGSPNELVLHAIQSLEHQLYPSWELCIVADPKEDSRSTGLLRARADADTRIKLSVSANVDPLVVQDEVLHMAKGEFIAFVGAADQLSETALYQVAVELNRHPHADILFSDEDVIDADGQRHQPHFKPDWNPDLFYGYNYLGHLTVCRRSIVVEGGGLRPSFASAQEYDLLLRLAERTTPDRIRHIPFVLYHSRANATHANNLKHGQSLAANAARHALSEHFIRMGQRGVEVLPGRKNDHNRVLWPVGKPVPLVSFVIPTAGRLAFLSNCLSGILNNTDYDNFEVVLLYNSSTEQEAFAYFENISDDPRVTIVDSCGDFNFSRICNLGVERARGEIICLLNDDIEVIEAGWLREMVGHVLRPQVGVVGAMLYYPDDTIQHAGVVLGLGDTEGIAAHVYRGLPRGSFGYFDRAALTQELSCVTAACLLVRRQLYRELGGFDVNLAVDFNDVDFCLKVRSEGYLIVWTPFAELYHLESVSRGAAHSAEKRRRFSDETQYIRQKWGSDVFGCDPFYNPNLFRGAGRFFELADAPRTKKPWR